MIGGKGGGGINTATRHKNEHDLNSSHEIN